MARKAGFSIVELLVVLAIIAVVLTILLPVYLRGREASRRIGCFNNQKQIILAVHNYLSAWRVLPSGCVDSGGPLAGVDQTDRMSWIASLLPYMEQSQIYHTIDFDRGPFDALNQTARETTMTTLLCPSSEARPRYEPPIPQGIWPWKVVTEPGFEGLTSYAGCHHDVEAAIDVDNHGVFFRNSRIRPIDVTDGLSQTIYLGEVSPASKLGWTSGSRSTLRNTGTPINQTAAEPGGGVVGGFGSRHKGGAVFAFGDGSARFIKESIDPAVYRRLGHRFDGEAIDDSSY